MDTTPLLTAAGGLPGPNTMQDHVRARSSHPRCVQTVLTAAACVSTSQPFAMALHPPEYPRDSPRLSPCVSRGAWRDGQRLQARPRVGAPRLAFPVRLLGHQLRIRLALSHHNLRSSMILNPLRPDNVNKLNMIAVLDLYASLLPESRGQ